MKRLRDVDEDIEIVTFEVISLHISIPLKFGLGAFNYVSGELTFKI